MSKSSELIQLDPSDQRSLQYAKNLLENPGLVAQLTNLVGTPLEAFFKKLPKGFSKRLNAALQSALTTSVRWAQKTLGDEREEAWSKSHMASVAVTGAVAGFMGPWAMLVEIPLTTTLIFRSIADIARSEGEPMRSAACIEECIKVFALGGSSKDDDATESGYYTVRASIALEVQLSANYFAKQMEKAAEKAAADAVVKSAKAATEAAPLSSSDS